MVDFTLKIDIPLKASEVLDLISKFIEIPFSDNSHLSGKGVWIAVNDRDRVTNALLVENYHFTPTVGIHFEPSKVDNTGNTTMLKVVFYILKMYSGDAVFLINGETNVLQRIKGELILNSNYDNWEKEYYQAVLQDVKMPYKIEALPQLI